MPELGGSSESVLESGVSIAGSTKTTANCYITSSTWLLDSTVAQTTSTISRSHAIAATFTRGQTLAGSIR
jgi:bifunctional N-acetylglucosamine-1-phosphate-uridyltransferase/glucosamine-1-phosphate-acetyltransferase GlmU-like protein